MNSRKGHCGGGAGKKTCFISDTDGIKGESMIVAEITERLQ